MGFLNNNTTVLYSCIAYAHSKVPKMKKRKKKWKQYITDNKTECLYWNQKLENESTEEQNNDCVETIFFFSSFFVYADKNYVYQQLK